MRTPFDDLIEALSPREQAGSAWTACAIAVLLALVALLVVHFTARAYAQPTRYAQQPPLERRAQMAPRVIFDCAKFGEYARRIAMLRDMGAHLDKVLIELRRDLRSGLVLAVLEREARNIYAGKPSRLDAEAQAYKRCQAQLGDMGVEG